MVDMFLVPLLDVFLEAIFSKVMRFYVPAVSGLRLVLQVSF